MESKFFHNFDYYKLLQYHQFKSGQLTQLMHQTNKRIKQTKTSCHLNRQMEKSGEIQRWGGRRAHGRCKRGFWCVGQCVGRFPNHYFKISWGTWLVSVGHAIKDAVSFTSPGYHICIFSYCNFNHISCNLISSTLFIYLDQSTWLRVWVWHGLKYKL